MGRVFICRTGWRMAGTETVSVVLHNPAGLPLSQHVAFNQAAGFWEATLTAVDVSPFSNQPAGPMQPCGVVNVPSPINCSFSMITFRPCRWASTPCMPK
jgi:hypothetical protein